ncbi:hypothetical protein [Quadrisphaera sp. INWT6]|uniref:hypothetical protein n=1 Tax=Quadrisphaera sp. INWT6 TaxID=2596917 RepID=UPI0018924351|nr:hypothetical protein [Quadrisphaera sp. INWT6]MBF5081830.1 hypothetical protein [Quadrisphaera sp. INWT6]
MASSARHRAATAPLTWAARSLITATTVPVGALAGCVVAAVAASAQNPGLGIAGLAAAGVPLTLREVRARRSARRNGRTRGRHVAGLEQVWPSAESATDSRDAVVVRLDSAVDPAEPSPAAFRALSLVPVAGAETRARAVAAETAEAVVLAIPAPRGASEPVEVVEPARSEVVLRLGADAADVVVQVEAAEASLVAPQQRAAEIAQLNRLWAAGTGPDTGSLRVAAPAA